MTMRQAVTAGLAGLAVTGIAGAFVAGQMGTHTASATAAQTTWGSTPPPQDVDARPTATATPAPLTGAVAPVALNRIHSIVALGDSVPAGSGSSAVPFPELFRRRLVPLNPGITLTNLGLDGETAAGLATSLSKDATTIAAVKKADVVLVTAGANDLYPAYRTEVASDCDTQCRTQAVQTAANALSTAIAEINAVDTRPGHRILVTTYWNAFTDGAVAKEDESHDTLMWTDAVTRQANGAFCTAATAAGATCVDIYTPFKGNGTKDPTSMLAADGDHPNAAGHAAIADALMKALTSGR